MSDQTQDTIESAKKAQQILSDIETVTGAVAEATNIVAKASLWTAIIGFFTALPGIVDLIQKFMAITGNNPQAMVSALGDAFSKIESAKTTQENSDAAQTLASAIGKLR